MRIYGETDAGPGGHVPAPPLKVNPFEDVKLFTAQVRAGTCPPLH